MPAQTAEAATADLFNCRDVLFTYAPGPDAPLGYRAVTLELATVNVGVWELGEAAWAMYDEAVDPEGHIRKRALEAQTRARLAGGR
jgi:hypothetical protein